MHGEISEQMSRKRLMILPEGIIEDFPKDILGDMLEGIQKGY